MLRKYQIEIFLIFSFGVCILSILFLSKFTTGKIEAGNNRSNHISENVFPRLRTVSNMQSAILKLRSFQLELIQASSLGPEADEKITQDFQRILNIKESIRQMCSEEDLFYKEELELVESIDKNLSIFEQSLKTFQEAFRNNMKDDAVMEIFASKNTYNAIEIEAQALENLFSREADSAVEINKSEAIAVKKNLSYLIYGIVSFVIFIGFMANRLVRWVIKTRISSSTQIIEEQVAQLNELKYTFSQLATQSQNLSSGVKQSLTSTSSATTEISMTVKQHSSVANESRVLSQQASGTVIEGLSGMESLNRTLTDISKEMNDFRLELDEGHRDFESILKLMNEIQQKTKVINDIVFQTKLLSFNASVEAARAGEYGKGFSVVAEEIGELATLSGASSQEISSMIANNFSKINELIVKAKSRSEVGVSKVNRVVQEGLQTSSTTTKSISKISETIENVSRIQLEVMESSVQQSDAIQSIVDDVYRSLEASEEMYKLAETIAKEAESLSSTISDLSESSKGLKILTNTSAS